MEVGLGEGLWQNSFHEKSEVGTLKRQKGSSLSNFEQPCIENLPVLISNSLSVMSTFNSQVLMTHFRQFWKIFMQSFWVFDKFWVSYPELHRYGCFLKWWYPQSPPQVLIISSRSLPHGCWGFPYHFRVHPGFPQSDQSLRIQKGINYLPTGAGCHLSMAGS